MGHEMEVRKVTIKEIVQLSKELAQKVRDCQPECVISIERGGYFIGEIIAKELGLPHHSIKIKRWHSKIPPYGHSLVRFIRYDLPSPFNRICRYVVNHLIDLINNKTKLEVTQNSNDEIDLNARILLIDDDVGRTGRTMRSALDCLKQKGFKHITTAVIQNENKEAFIADYSVVPSSPLLIFLWPWRLTSNKDLQLGEWH